MSSLWVFLGEDLASEDPGLYLIFRIVDEISCSNFCRLSRGVLALLLIWSVASFLFSDGLSSGCYFFFPFDSSSRFGDSIEDLFWSFLCIFAFVGLYANAYVFNFFLD